MPMPTPWISTGLMPQRSVVVSISTPHRGGETEKSTLQTIQSISTKRSRTRSRMTSRRPQGLRSARRMNCKIWLLTSCGRYLVLVLLSALLQSRSGIVEYNYATLGFLAWILFQRYTRLALVHVESIIPAGEPSITPTRSLTSLESSPSSSLSSQHFVNIPPTFQPFTNQPVIPEYRTPPPAPVIPPQPIVNPREMIYILWHSLTKVPIPYPRKPS